MIRRAALLLLAAALAAGCGSSRRAATTTEPARPTATEYRRQANTACAALNERIERLPAPRSEREIGPLLRRIIRTEAATIGQLAALEPPRRLLPLHRRFLALSRRLHLTLESQLRDIEAGRRPLAVLRRDLPDQQRLFGRANAIARRLGLPACAVTPQPRGRSAPTA